jgi:glycosyltransferase involved in cell wall biosynthesis
MRQAMSEPDMSLRPRICLLAGFPLHLLPGFQGKSGPCRATWLPPLARALEHQQEFEIHWITCSKDVSTAGRVDAWNQTFHWIPRGRLSVEILTGFHAEVGKIHRLMSRLNPALVHAWGTEEGYAKAASTWPGRRLLSVQGILQVCCQVAPAHPFLRIQARLERKTLPRFACITVESEWGKKKLASLSPASEIVCLEYGVEPASFEVQRQAGYGNLALYVGTLSRLKGVDLLLTAFTDRRLAGIRLVLIGEGPLGRHPQKHPAAFHFAGHLPQVEVRQWMSQASFLIHPTRADTSPNCVKEARVIGLPVVTTAEGGQTAYVEEGLSGLIIPPNDAEALIQAVLKAAERIVVDPEFGSSGREACRLRLDPLRTSTSLLSLYRRLLASPGVDTMQ